MVDERRAQTAQPFAWRHAGWLVAISVGIGCLAFFSAVQDTFSDPKLNFVVSQAILEHGTIRLDAYRGDLLMGRPYADYVTDLDIITINGHDYHYFPVGPSLLGMPFVWVANQFGMDMRTTKNFGLQSAVAALTCMLVFVGLVGIGRNLHLTPGASLTIATVAVVGSGLISTLGTALWSLNWTTLCYVLVFYLLTRVDPPDIHGQLRFRPRTKAPSDLSGWAAVLLGLLLFLAFFNRASAAALIVPLFVYLSWRDWRAALQTMGTAGVLLACYLFWSYMTFGDWLPAYYSIGRLSVERAPVWVGMVGNLLSPSRGILVFSPFFLLIPVGVLLGWKRLRANALFWLCLTWFALHIWLVARAAKWYGGWSFGPRLLVDASVALVVMLFLLWRVAERFRRTTAVAFVVLGSVAIVFNSVIGLYDRGSARWNDVISPVPSAASPHPLGDMFVWRYGQFMAGQRRVCAIEAEKGLGLIAVDTLFELTPNVPLPLADDAIATYRHALYSLPLADRPVFIGWEVAQSADFRWSICPSAAIYFTVDGISADAVTLEIIIDALHLSADLYLNDAELGTITTTGDHQFALAGSRFNHTGVNELRLEMPAVRRAGWDDQRLLGIGLKALKISAAP